KDHKCDTCKETLSQCADADKDGECDLCGEAVLPSHTCADINKDHKCDTCKETLSQCADADKDGECDLCGEAVLPSHTCADINKDHKCDTCKETLSQCADADKDGECDLCGEAVLPSHTCADINKDHKCDTCKETLSQCADADKDHKCDECTKALSTCADKNANHKCDVCDKTLSWCVDTDADGDCNFCKQTIPQHTCTATYRAHQCDVCSAVLSAHTDKNSDHHCDVCSVYWELCSDENNDHHCDVCGEKKTECMDVDVDRRCDICKAAYTRNETADGSALSTENVPSSGYYGVYATDTDTGTYNTTVNFPDGMACYRFYLHFAMEVDNVRITDGEQYGLFTAGAGYIKNGRFIVPMLYMPRSTQQCTEISMHYIRFVDRATGGERSLTTGIYFRFVRNCVVPNFLGVSTDGNLAHASNVASVKFTDVKNPPADGFYIYLHFDGPIGGGGFLSGSSENGGTIINNRNYVLYENGNYILKAEVNVLWIGTYRTEVNYTWRPVDGLAGMTCDLFTIVVEPGVRCAQCAPDTDEDGRCDACGNLIISCTHRDENSDHICDACGHEISFFVDTDKNHLCDVCGKIPFECHDSDMDHICDICGAPLVCINMDGDHECDICKEKLSDCKDEDEDGICDLCKAPCGEEEVNKETYLALLADLQDGNQSTTDWYVAIDPSLAPYLFSDLSLATDEWFVGAEILFIHRLAKEMNYRVNLVPLSKEGCITALKSGAADAAIGCFTADAVGTAAGILISASYASIVDPQAIAPTELVVLTRADKESDLSMINKAIDFIESEGAYATWLAAAEAYVKASDGENIDELGYYADGKKIYAGDVCEHEDENGDHECDHCHFDGMFCTDDDYDGNCDTCSRTITGAEILKDPRLIGYSTEPYGNFFESMGILEFKYNTPTTVYLKFNCEVDPFSIEIVSGYIEPTLYYTDATGAVYIAEFPAIDHIFFQDSVEFSFGTAYNPNAFASISYSCMPEAMPEYLGTVQDGILSPNSYLSKLGETVTVQFAMNVEVELGDTLFANGNTVQLMNWHCESAADGTYYIYTVSFNGQDVSAYDTFNLFFTYFYLGASGGSDGGFLPAFTVPVQIVPYVLLGATVNGISVYETFAQIPYSEVYEILLTLNQPADVLEMAFEGLSSGELYSEENGTYVYRFTSSNLPFGYVNAPVIAYNGSYPSHFAALSFEILEENGGGASGGEGGEGGGEENPTLPTVLEVYNAVNGVPVAEKDVVYIWADGKLSLLITFDRSVAETYIKWNDELYYGEDYSNYTQPNTFTYTVPMPMSMSKEEGTFTLCIYEGGCQHELAEYDYKKEAALFFGIYLDPAQLDIEGKPYSITMPAGQDATVYLAVTAPIDPEQLFLASGATDYVLEPLQNPWWLEAASYTDSEGDPMHVWFYEVHIPAQYLTPGEPETVNPQKLAFIQSDGGTEGIYYDDIFQTYVINIAE
ncbi:MAG: hypothetical protein IJZ24_04015, partial [Clostridia bacterium]|nr:hypothetical protein [Clostridia bacterium]